MGEKPEGITEVMQSETDLVFAIIRTQLFDPNDLGRVKEIQSKYRLQRLSAFTGQTASAKAPEIQFPRWVNGSEYSVAAFNYMNFVLDLVDIHTDEVELMARFARIGIGTPDKFNVSEIDLEVAKALDEGVQAGLAEMRAFAEAHSTDPLASAKGFGTREFLKESASYFDQPIFYLQRATVAMLGIYGNSGVEAIYPAYFVDSGGSPLNAAEHDYIMKFEAGALPPVKAFWSLSMYDGPTQLFIHNPLNRYLLNSDMTGQFVKEKDGSIVFYIQKDSPGKDREASWLPAPDGPFYLVLRLYLPEEHVLEGKWTPPHLEKMKPLSASGEAVDSRIGKLAFQSGYPTDETVQKLYDELDFQRAVQVYLWALPMASYGAMADAHKALGADSHTVIVAENSAEQQQLVLTANQDTVYMSGVLDLREGPMVMELPPGLLGTLNNIWQQPVVDLGGPFSPEQNRGGRFLILPPGYDGPLPQLHHHVVPSDTNIMVFYLRAIPKTRDDFPKLVELMHAYRQYKLSESQDPPQMRFINTSGKEADFLTNEGFAYFESLARYINENPPRPQDMAMLGILETLGIAHGRPFEPDARIENMLTRVTEVVRAMAKTIAWQPRMPKEVLYAYQGKRQRSWLNRI